jgi:hypothetical protein
MARVASLPPADRFWARLDRFECECPSCAQVFSTGQGRGRQPHRLNTLARQRAAARKLPGNISVQGLIFNPVTQRVECPFCHTVYVAGLLLYSVRTRRRLQEPPDTIPTPHQRAALRRFAGGWWLNQLLERDEDVNLRVDLPCICPEPDGWAVACPVHGEGAKGTSKTTIDGLPQL